jgi:hypothetical protein
MSSIVISGDVSGSVTLQAPSAAGTTVLTLPATSGTVITGAGGVTGTSAGGTGLSSFTSGGAMYATSTSALTTGTLPVASGGTGATSATAYAVQCGGTTSTGAHQSVASLGTSGQVLTSQGASALPTWTTISTSPPTNYNDIGTYYIGFGLYNTAYSVNSTIAGSDLAYISSGSFGGMSNVRGTSGTADIFCMGQVDGSRSGSGLSGTWRCMTHGGSAPTTNRMHGHLWVRIS